MEYIIRIKPIEAFGTIATRLHIRLFYVLFGSSQTCFIEYKSIDGNNMYSKNIILPEDLVAKWGTNDDVILKYIVKTEKVEVDNSPVFFKEEQKELQTKEQLITPTEANYQTPSEIVEEVLKNDKIIVEPKTTNA